MWPTLRKGRVLRWFLISSGSLFLLILALLLFINAMGWLSFREPTSQLIEQLETRTTSGQPRMDTLQLINGRLCYASMERPGEKRPAVLFVHGTPGSLSAFTPHLTNDALLQRANLYAPDRPGFGDSNFGEAMPRLADQAAALKQMVDQLHLDPVILVGHSLGCSIIGRYAMDYPDQVDGLLMIAAPIDPNLEPPNWWRKIMAWPIFYPFIPTSFWVSNEELVILEDELREIQNRWNEIQVPVIFMHGTEDMLVPVENMVFAESQMQGQSNVTIDTLSGENHFIVWSHMNEASSRIFRLIDLALIEK